VTTSKDVIVKIISAVKNYRTPLGVKFVDRELEVEKVINEEEKAIFNGMINVLYGPKGCGKTTLFRALQSTIELEDLGVDVLYAAGEYEETSQLIKLYIPKTLGEVLKEIASTIGGSIEVGFRDLNVISAPITFFKAVRVIVESIVKN
jgi:AAA+ ATPase superfamily predicted ATPase